MMRFVLLLSFSIDAFQTPSPRTAAVRPLQQHSQHRNTQRSPRRNTFALRSTLADTVISAGVSIDTFLPQFFWLPMIAFPRAELTKRVNGNLLPVLAIEPPGAPAPATALAFGEAAVEDGAEPEPVLLVARGEHLLAARLLPPEDEPALAPGPDGGVAA